MAANDRADLRSRARIRADQVESLKPTDAQYNAFLTASAEQVYADLLQAGFPHDDVVQTITATGAVSYVLNGGATIFGITEVLQQIGSEFFEVRKVNASRIASLRSLSASTGGPAGYYDLHHSFTAGPHIEFLPRPTSGTYVVRYVNAYSGLSSDAAVWRGPASSDELLVLRAAAKALRNEGETADANALDAEYADLIQHVMTQASFYDMRGPAGHIRDVEGARHQDPFDFNVRGEGW